MTKRFRVLATAAALSLGLLAAAPTAQAQDAQTCQPGLAAAFSGPYAARYVELLTALAPSLGTVTTRLNDFLTIAPNQEASQPKFQLLYNAAIAAVNGVSPLFARIVITLPDGTFVLDTNSAAGQGVGAITNGVLGINGTFENKFSSMAMRAAQDYPCGIGVERNRYRLTNYFEYFVAIRVGSHLASTGTIILSSIPDPPTP